MKKIIFTLLLICSIQFCFAQESWAPTSTGSNVPTAREFHTSVWTGNKMIIWGGVNGSTYYNTGGLYDPAADSWTQTTLSNVPDVRDWHTAVWTGSKMIIWGGYNGTQLNTGGVYDTANTSWFTVSTSNAPSARQYHTSVWTGTTMIIWGGYDGSESNTGGVYNPLTNTWIQTATSNAPSGRHGHTSVWTGSKMIIWGGVNGTTYLNDGKIYDPSNNSWSEMNGTSPTARVWHTAVWTGNKMIVWGGNNASNSLSSGGIYDLSGDSWSAVSTTNTPLVRTNHTAIWTGSKMVIWGGVNGNNNTYYNTGGIFDLLTGLWEAEPTTINAPPARNLHKAVWTGSKMIVWGGFNGINVLLTGGVYTNPAIIGIHPISTEVPNQFYLMQNYPNPFNPTTKIRFALPNSSFAKLVIYDALGRELETLVNEQLNAGTYEADWNATDFPCGVYFYILSAGEFSEARKAVLIK